MLFNSIPFLLFFPAVCLLYYCIPQRITRARNTLLLIASYFFYMNWQPVYALLLLTSTVVTWGAALFIERSEGNTRKWWLTAAIVLNLSILFLFKYYGFLADNIEELMGQLGMDMSMPELDILLPVGISFYTFQALGYAIDVYRGDTKVEKDFFTYSLFVSFFPQLVAGPIERSKNLLPQFKQQHGFSSEMAMAGLRMMVWGYFLKLVMADRCGIYVDAVYDNVEMHNGGSYIVATILFAFQIYGDFAGYSLIAIGAAKVMGFQLMVNFKRPYLSHSIGEFWKRWHISLSSWFKDYLYIPLGGNRVGRLRHYINLMVTFVVSGIWHGANWTFLLWGILHGFFICVEKALGLTGKKETRKEKPRLLSVMRWAVTFLIVCLAWVVFRADSWHDAATIYAGMFTDLGLPFVEDVGMGCLLASAVAIVVVTVKDLADEHQWRWFGLSGHGYVTQCVYVSFMIAVITLFGVLGADQFIYFQF